LVLVFLHKSALSYFSFLPVPPLVSATCLSSRAGASLTDFFPWRFTAGRSFSFFLKGVLLHPFSFLSLLVFPARSFSIQRYDQPNPSGFPSFSVFLFLSSLLWLFFCPPHFAVRVLFLSVLFSPLLLLFRVFFCAFLCTSTPVTFGQSGLSDSFFCPPLFCPPPILRDRLYSLFFFPFSRQSVFVEFCFPALLFSVGFSFPHLFVLVVVSLCLLQAGRLSF